MSVTESFLSRLSQKIKAFYLDQQGVYGVMTALLLLPLIMLVAFTVETTGILLDKTRLSQATDQAALLLTAENDEFRAKKDHSDLMRQNLTAQEKALPADKQFSTRVAKRNQELVQDTVKLYLRSYGEGANAPITITKDFTAFCEPISKSGKAEEGVTCTVQGDVRRKNSFGIIDEWVKSPDGRLPVNSGASYAVKQNSSVPMEIMFVADYSGSMKEDLNGNKPPKGPTKVQVLREVIDEVTQILLPVGTSKNVDNHNRVGFVTFATGIRQKGEKQNCALPIFGIAGQDTEKVNYKIRLRNYDKNLKTIPEISEKAAKRNNRPTGYFRNCQQAVDDKAKPIPDRYDCDAEDTREEAIKITMTEWDYDHARELMLKYIDLRKTIDQIDTFNGSLKKYSLTLDTLTVGNTQVCPDNHNQPSSNAWFDNAKDQKDLMKMFNSIEPNDQTSASSGMITATNIMSEKDKAYQAKLDKIGMNSKKIMVIVSDGFENMPYHDSFPDLVQAGMCQKIKDKLNSLQNPKYKKEDARLAFVAIGYDPKYYIQNGVKYDYTNHYNAWKSCVDDYFYVVKSKQELLAAFSDIFNIQEELGTGSSQKIKRK